jgi:hypothetical protein
VTTEAALRRGKRRGKHPGGPGAHQEHSGEVSLAGDGTAAVNSEVAALGFPARNSDGGGDSGHGASISSARRTREVRRCWGRARRRSGRCLSAALAGGHGGRARSLGGVHEKVSRKRRKKGKRGGLRGAEEGLQDVSSTTKR